MGIYSQLINLSKLTINALNDTLKSMFRMHKRLGATGTPAKKSRVAANYGRYDKAIRKRRRLTELAKQSRRINWQVAKGVSIRG